jgi:hypothetical protein
VAFIMVGGMTVMSRIVTNVIFSWEDDRCLNCPK